MKSSTVNGTLLLVNLGLIACVGYLLARRPASAPAATPGPAVSAVVTSAPQVIIKGAAPRVVTVTNAFQWAQLETEDYREYITRLRSIGCPEQTIRDLIIADLDKLLAPKVHGIYGRRQQVDYWHSEEEELANERNHRDWARQERAVEQEKRAIILELLGVDVVRERMRQKGYADYYERRLGFLPENKRTAVRLALEEYDELEQAVRTRQQEPGGLLSAADRTELSELRAERQEALGRLLSPAEQQLYDRWLSPSANAVRYAFYGMDATEEEFLAVYELRKTFDHAWSPDDLAGAEPDLLEEWSLAQEAMDDRIREALGEERYALYRRGEDPDWHRLNAALTQHQLPRELAAAAYDIKQAYLQTRDYVLGDPAMAPNHREAILREMTAQSHQSLQELLGPQACRDLRGKLSGDWFP